MRLRRAVIATLVLGLVAATTSTATAAPPKKKAPVKKYCLVLKDRQGDDGPAVDIVSGDIATGRKEVVGVLRMNSMNFSSTDLDVVRGIQWSLAATLQGQDLQFYAKKGMLNGPLSGGVKFGGVAVSTTAPKIIGNNFEWRVPRSLFKPLAKPKMVLSEIRGDTKVFSSTADVAPPAGEKYQSYPDQAPSCVVAR